MDDEKMRLDVAKEVYREVLSANFHQSEIAARLLAPVAFLTAAATTLFVSFERDGISFLWRDIDFTLVFYLIYLFCTLMGTIFIIEVIGPSFVTKDFKRKREPKNSEPTQERLTGKNELGDPKSILFFKSILEEDKDTWMDVLLNKKIGDLQHKFIHDCANESYVLAEKTQKKVIRNLIARLFFYLSFCSLFLMTYTGIVDHLEAWNEVTGFTVVVILITFGIFEVGTTLKLHDELKGS